MIAIFGEKVVGCSLKLLRDFLDYVLNLVLGAEGEALQQLAAECTSWWLRVWLCPVYSRYSWPVMAAECVFSIQALYDDTSVEEGAAKEPESGGDRAWLCPHISAYRQID